MIRYITKQELIQCILDAVELGTLSRRGGCLYIDNAGRTCAIGAALTKEERERLRAAGANGNGVDTHTFERAVNVDFLDRQFACHVQSLFDQPGRREDFLREVMS